MQYDLNKTARNLATWFGAGMAPKAPGTVGTFAGLPLLLCVQYILGTPGLAVLAVLLFILGWWASGVYMQQTGEHDPKEIVIDEVAGMALALLTAPLTPMACILAFALFRFFDALKPWPISLADKHIKGAFGVMFDDTLAGLATLVILWVLL